MNFSMYVQLDMECIGLEGQGICDGALSNMYYYCLSPTFSRSAAHVPETWSTSSLYDIGMG
jgi:hypothetical protein